MALTPIEFKNTNTELQHISQALTIADANGIYIHVNEAFASILGEDATTVIGKSLYDFIPESSVDLIHDTLKVCKSGKTHQFNLILKNSSQKLIETSFTCIPISRDNEFQGVISVINNLTVAKQINEKVQRKEHLLKGVSEALNALISHTELQQGISKAIEIIGKATKAAHVFFLPVTILDVEGNSIVSQLLWQAENAKDVSLHLKDIGSFCDVIFEKEYSYLSTGMHFDNKMLAYYLNKFKNLDKLGLRSFILIPIVLEKVPIGVIGINSFEKDFEWSADEINALIAFTSSTSAMINSVLSKLKFKSQKLFYENVLNRIPSDVVVFDKNHRYKFINPIAISDPEIREWLIDRDDFEYVAFRNRPIEIAENRRAFFNKVVESKKMHFWEEKVTNAEGKDKWILRYLYPVFNGNDELEMVIGYGLDITERVKQEKELIKAREEAIESQKVKQNFLAKVSHEIRTPMNGVIGVMNLLDQSDLNEEQEEYIGILRESSSYLMHLIDDILDLSKMNEGKFTLSKNNFNLNEILNGVIYANKQKAESKKLDFITNLPENNEQLVFSDPVRVRQILMNLISNAIKFTHSGSVEFSVKTSKPSFDKLNCVFTIKDTGVGIEESHKGNLFQAFQQGKPAVGQQFGGTGLGLSIVKEIVQLMNGTIDISSTLNSGTEFNVYLTFDLVKQGAIEKQKDLITDNNLLKGLHLLVVDDHLINLKIATKIVEHWGVTVETAQNGAECLNILNEKKFDVILMDMQMPVIDGIEATRLIRKSDKDFKTIPIIAMTAAALPEERERCLNSGMNDYLAKPFNPNNLLELLKKHFVPTQQEIVEVVETEVQSEFFNLDYLNEVCGDNRDFLKEMIGMFKADIPVIVEDMRKHLALENYSELSKTAHKGKSAAGYMNAAGMRTLLISIEEEVNKATFSNAILSTYIDKTETIYTQIIAELAKKDL
jgi:PAS domain S-box-containing protein